MDLNIQNICPKSVRILPTFESIINNMDLYAGNICMDKNVNADSDSYFSIPTQINYHFQLAMTKYQARPHF